MPFTPQSFDTPRGTTVVNNGVVVEDKKWLIDVARQEAAAREAAMADGANDAPVIDPAEIAGHMADVRAHNATIASQPASAESFAKLVSEYRNLARRVEAMELSMTSYRNSENLANRRENAALMSAAGGASGAVAATHEVAAKTDSTKIIDELGRQASYLRGEQNADGTLKLYSRGTIRNALDGTDGAGNCYYPLRRLARDIARAKERTYLGREALTTEEGLLKWLASPSEVASQYMGRPGIAATPWMALRSVENAAEYPPLYRALFTELFKSRGLAGPTMDTAIGRYMVPFGTFDGD